MTVSYDENEGKITVIDFSPTEGNRSENEIMQELQDNQHHITGAKVIWIVNVHIRPGLMLVVAKSINFQLEQINFISKDFLLKMEILQNDKAESSKLPCLDSCVKKLFDCKSKFDLFEKPQSILQINGYKISKENIQLIRKCLDKKVNMEIKN